MIESELEELRNLTPREFEIYIAELLQSLVIKKIRLTSQSADAGYDISSEKDGKLVLFECKKYVNKNHVGAREVRIFADTCGRLNAEKGIFITTSSFTRTVYQEQKARALDLEFWEGKDLIVQKMNVKKSPAYCIECEKIITGYYSKFQKLDFDWFDKICDNFPHEKCYYRDEKTLILTPNSGYIGFFGTESEEN